MGGFLVFLAVVGAGYVWMLVSRARLAEAEQEQHRELCRRQIALDPSHVGAHEALADSLRAAGRLTEARDAYLRALEACGETIPNAPIQYKLRQVDLALHERVAGGPSHEVELILCPRCGGVNPPHVRVCETCDSLLPYRTFREAARDKELQRATAECAACLLVVALAFRVYSAMPLDIKGCLVMSATIVIGWRFLQALGPRRM